MSIVMFIYWKMNKMGRNGKMETLLIFQDEESNKFWKIAVTGNTYTITFGKKGTTGAVKTKKFVSRHICENEACKMIEAKMKQGYKPVEYSAHIIKESSMDEELFWKLIETAKNKGEDSESQLEWLIRHLARKPIKEIIKFDSIFNENYQKSYSSDIWAAAYIILGGCSDDCFDYFRAWLLYLGKEKYEEAVSNPESIIPYLNSLHGEMPQLEELTCAAMTAYEEKTGMDDGSYYDLYEQLAGNYGDVPELILDWDEDDEDALQQKFPLLWELYGENPLEY